MATVDRCCHEAKLVGLRRGINGSHQVCRHRLPVEVGHEDKIISSVDSKYRNVSDVPVDYGANIMSGAFSQHSNLHLLIYAFT